MSVRLGTLCVCMAVLLFTPLTAFTADGSNDLLLLLTDSSAPNPYEDGFHSNFRTEADGWESVAGDWSLTDDDYLFTEGIAGKYVSVQFAGSDYQNLDYSARVGRFGCDACWNFLWVRGDPSRVSGSYNWAEGYYFAISQAGYYSVYSVMDGDFYAIQSPTASQAITSGWNVIRVRAIGEALAMWVNGTAVWWGELSTHSTGRVGVGTQTRTDATGQQGFFVDYAVLTVP